MGFLSIAFGVRVFVGHGGASITVLGLYSLALALFIGMGGAFVALTDDPRASTEYLGGAILAGLALQILTGLLGWRYRVDHRGPPQPSSEHLRWMTRWGAALFTVLVGADVTGLTGDFESLAESAAFASIVVLAIGQLLRTDTRLVSWRLVAVLASMGVYVAIFHTGGGRLRIVALGAAIALLLSLRWPKRRLKWAMLASVPPALALLAVQRLQLQESIAHGASAGRSGLESMFTPILVLARLIEEQAAGMSKAWGVNLLSMPLSFLPDSWLSDPPQALGYELVDFYAPDRTDTGYSLAVTSAGEAIYNFGLLGILVAAPFIALLCNGIDRRIRRAAQHAEGERLSLVRLAAWLTVGGAIADLAWNGWHVFSVRTLTRLPVLAVLAAIAVVRRRLAPPEPIRPRNTISEPPPTTATHLP